MKATDDLYKLIYSLSKAEKRYFKLLAGRYDSGEKNNYIKLFDAIEKQAEYDEQQIKSTFAKETFIKHLPSEKNYLYNLILDSLHLFHSEEDIAFKLQKRIHHASILFNRGLADHSIKLLKKAKESAEAHELYHVLLDILQLEKKILTKNYYSGVSETDIDAIYEEEKKCIGLIAETNNYWQLFSRFYQFHYRKGSSRDVAEWEKIKAIMAHPLLTDFNKASTFQSKIDFLHIHALFHFMAGEPAKAYEFNKKQLALLESEPDKLKTHVKRYMATLNNSLMDGLGLGLYNEVEAGIEKLQKLPQKFSSTVNERQRADIFRLSSILELNIILKRGNFEEGTNKAENIIKQFQLFENQIVKHNQLTLYYLLAYVFFGAGKYKDAIRWLNKIINDTEEDVLQDIHAFARIFSLIIHYELQNHELLEYLNQSTTRYLNRRSKVYKAESILLKYLKKLTSNPHSAKQKNILFQEMQTVLQPLVNDAMERKAFEYFDLLSWVESKLSGKSFAYIVQGKNA